VTDLREHLVVVRGGGDLGTGVAWRLRRAGFPVVVLDLPRPLAVRRTVAFASAIIDGSIVVDGVGAVHVPDAGAVRDVLSENRIPVIASDVVPDLAQPHSVIVDARVAKRVLDTRIDDAPFVVALGPGFVAGVDCDAVVETKRGHRLGRVIWEGPAAADTGTPGVLGGASAERVVRSPVSGNVSWTSTIGDIVGAGDLLGSIDGEPIAAPIAGVVRGLIAPGPVDVGLKIGDIDPRGDAGAATEISDKALSVGGGVLEAILVWLNGAET
jgi:xanthine dehydrogenase accessory factor